MAKMMGKVKESVGNRDYEKSNSAVRHEEDGQWSKESVEEINDFPHENNLCSDPKTGMVGCEVCYPDDHLWHADPKDLEGIERVTMNERPID
jgi:hypothetical protein